MKFLYNIWHGAARQPQYVRTETNFYL